MSNKIITQLNYSNFIANPDLNGNMSPILERVNDNSGNQIGTATYTPSSNSIEILFFNNTSGYEGKILSMAYIYKLSSLLAQAATTVAILNIVPIDFTTVIKLDSTEFYLYSDGKTVTGFLIEN